MAEEEIVQPTPEKKAVKKSAKKPRKKSAKKSSRKSSKKPSKALVIVESPAKARTINRYLGSKYEVTSSMGHVRDLPKSRIGIEVENGFEPNYIVIQKAKKRVSLLKKEAKNKTDIYLATDPDREGEAISWHLAKIFEPLGVPIHRVVFNEITKSAILKAFENPREIAQDLVDAQQARRILDRLFGYNLSPLLWKKVGKGLSAGRVQSIALRLIVDRENEIRRFNPEEYWTVTAHLKKKDGAHEVVVAELEKIKGEKVEIKEGSVAEAVKTAAENEPFKIVQIDSKERKRKPQAPYITSKLQQEAYQRYRFTSARTMQIAQRLYEGVDLGDEGSIGLITYMRTDSVNVAKQAQEEALEFIKETYGAEYVPEKPNVYKSKKAAQEAHEAIRPTAAGRTPESIRSFLSDEEWKVYDLIWKKFVASQIRGALEEGTTVRIECAKDYLFKATGTRTLFPGFLIVYKEKHDEAAAVQKEGEKTRELPKLSKGEELNLESLVPEQHFTKPPARYNDASIVKALEEGGIGRPSTYAPTIQVILARYYVERENNALIPSALGETVTKLLVDWFPELLEAGFTANLENNLDEVEEGKRKWVSVVEEFYAPFSKLMEVAQEKMKEVKRELEETGEKCEKCGKAMVIRYGRFGRFVACSGFPECKNTKDLTTDVECPREECPEGMLVKRKSKRGSTFYGCNQFPKCDFITNRLPKEDEKLLPDMNKPVPLDVEEAAPAESKEDVKSKEDAKSEGDTKSEGDSNG